MSGGRGRMSGGRGRMSGRCRRSAGGQRTRGCPRRGVLTAPRARVHAQEKPTHPSICFSLAVVFPFRFSCFFLVFWGGCRSPLRRHMSPEKALQPRWIFYLCCHFPFPFFSFFVCFFWCFFGPTWPRNACSTKLNRSRFLFS